jgi:two-component system, NarL family, response regulator LiaR
MPIHILLCDDHPIVRDGLSAILSTQDDFEVVGEASTGTEAVQKAVALKPDVILLDLEMPELDGAEALKQIRIACPTARAIVFTAFDTDERIVAAVQAGAHGYLLKGVPRDELFKAIRVVSEGGSLLQPIIASKLLNHVRTRHEDATDAEPLTDREKEVLALLAQGKSNKEIAAALVISERTVKFHVSAIMGKLGAGNRTEAVSIAAGRGLVKLNR